MGNRSAAAKKLATFARAARDVDLDCLLGDTELAGDLFLRHASELSENENLAAAAGQRLDRLE